MGSVGLCTLELFTRAQSQPRMLLAPLTMELPELKMGAVGGRRNKKWLLLVFFGYTHIDRLFKQAAGFLSSQRASLP